MIDFRDRTVKFYAIALTTITLCVSITMLGLSYMERYSSLEEYQNLSAECSDMKQRCLDVAIQCTIDSDLDYTSYMLNMSYTSDGLCEIMCRDRDRFDPMTPEERLNQSLDRLIG